MALPWLVFKFALEASAQGESSVQEASPWQQYRVCPEDGGRGQQASAAGRPEPGLHR